MTGAATLGIPAGLAGLVVGCVVHAPTAPFAAVELGVPGALAGALTGSIAGATGTAVRHGKR